MKDCSMWRTMVYHAVLRWWHPYWWNERQLSWGTLQNQFHKTSKQLKGESHSWRRLYVFCLLMELSEWRKKFKYVNKWSLRLEHQQRCQEQYGLTFTTVITAGVRWAKIDKYKSVTKEIMNFHNFAKISWNTTKQWTWESKMLIKYDIITKKPHTWV
jgi:hypothetical protein